MNAGANFCLEQCCTLRPASTRFLPVGDQWMKLAVREGLLITGCTALTADRTSFMSYTDSAGLGPSPCRIAKRVPCRQGRSAGIRRRI